MRETEQCREQRGRFAGGGPGCRRHAGGAQVSGLGACGTVERKGLSMRAGGGAFRAGMDEQRKQERRARGGRGGQGPDRRDLGVV